MPKPNPGISLFKLKASSHMTAAILLVLFCAVFISLLSERHYVRWDLTASQEHTLSEKTLQALKALKQPIAAKAFVKESSDEAADLKKLLAAYTYHCKGLSLEFIDPDRHPGLARKYDVQELNTVVLEGDGRSQTVKRPNEEALTNGLIRLFKSRTEKIYWIIGHGERPFHSGEPESLETVHRDLSRQNTVFEEWNLAQKSIPSDAAMLVIAAPEKDFFPEEVASLRRFLNKGGSLLLFLEPYRDGGLKDFLREYGLVITSDMVVDKMSRVMGGDFLLPMILTYGEHEITRNFRLLSFFSLARSIEVDRNVKKKGLTLTNLALTSPDSWAEMNRDALEKGTARLEEDDRQGPLSLAVIVESTPPEPQDDQSKDQDPIIGRGKMAVFGDVDFASNKFITLAGNKELLTNTIHYLVGQKDLIAIPKKEKHTEHLMLTRQQGLLVFWVPVVLIPLAVVILGVWVWTKRRPR